MLVSRSYDLPMCVSTHIFICLHVPWIRFAWCRTSKIGVLVALSLSLSLSVQAHLRQERSTEGSAIPDLVCALAHAPSKALATSEHTLLAMQASICATAEPAFVALTFEQFSGLIPTSCHQFFREGPG